VNGELDPTQRQVMRQGNGQSIMMIRLGGQDYPLENHPRCPVCQNPYREQIEQAIIGGRVFSKIAASIPEGNRPTTHAIKRHADLHLAEGQAHLRKRLETRAIARGLNIESGEAALVDEIALAEMVVDKTYQAVASGEIKPKLIDGLRAAKLLADYAVESTDNSDDMAEAFVQYMDEAAASMTPEQFADFNRRLDANPVLQSLVEKAERDLESPVDF
jgi:hypothetical protein